MNDLQTLINESVQLLFIGMGTVFFILILLIFLINMIGKGLSMLNLEDEQKATQAKLGSVRKKTVTGDNELIAVISSAVATYKKNHSVN